MAYYICNLNKFGYPAFKTIMHKFFLLYIIISAFFGVKSFAQDTLPNISVKNISGRIIISWKNNYGAKISNINIQRSYDSLRNFTTIGTVLNPLSKENGYVDRNAANPKMFYRVFVAFEGGTYLFSRSHKPVVEVPAQPPKDTVQNIVIDFTQRPPIADTVVSQAADNTTERIKSKHPPQVAAVQEELIPPRKFPPKLKPPAGFVASKFIFSNKENNLIINLPDADKAHFTLKFFDEKDKPVFEIKKITESYLIVEKVNFLHPGWFYYHLYNDAVLLEKYKFYIARDGWMGQPPPEIKKTPSLNEQ
jgi:hypothetical protein